MVYHYGTVPYQDILRSTVTGLQTEGKYGNVHLTVTLLISSVANTASGAFLTLDPPGSLINIPDSQNGSIHFVI